MGRFLNPFTDSGFKLLFGREISKSLLIDFLNVLLAGERKVQDITYLNTEALPDTVDGRGVVFDIRCLSDTGEEFIIEMQNKAQLYVKDRFVYYMSRAMNNQGQKGEEWKFSLRPVYGIFLLNFKTDVYGKGCLRTDTAIMNMKTGALFSDKFRMIFIELPYFDKEEDDCNTDFDCWLYIFTHMNILDRMPWQAQNAAFKKLLDIADIASLTPTERRQYDATLDAYRNWSSTIEYNTIQSEEAGMKKGLEKGLEKGLKKGMEKGKKVGLKEGLKKGMEKGLKEGAIKMAREMKRKQYDMAEIESITGLSLSEIEQL